MWVLHLCAVVCCCLAAVHGQAFTVTSQPALFSGSGQTVVEGSVIWLYCETNSTSPTLTVTWNKDNTEIVEDVPHIFTRRSTSGSSTTFLLGVNNLQVSDGGTYQCSVQDGADTDTGDMITLTVSAAVAGSLQFISVDTPGKFLFRGRPATGYAIGETATIEYEIGHVGDDMTAYTAPQQVQWLKDGLPAVRTPTNTPGTNGRLTSILSFTFAASDAGVYQCVFTDTSSSEIFVTVTTRLDTGSSLSLEAVSPSTIILSPPEKLVLEVRATGQYNFIVWNRNGDQASTSGFPVSNTDNFAHFSEIYVNDMTTMDDLGRYEVQLPSGASGISAADNIEFIVITSDGANTTVTSGAGVVVLSEGDNVNISCSSAGVPIPTITWTLRDQPIPFEQIDVQTDIVVLFVRDVNDDLVPDVTPGSVESTLQIMNAQYPAHDGVYQCTGSNSHAGQNFSQSVTITVQVQVPPVVDLTANQLVVGEGGTLILTCNVTRGNPMSYIYVWTHVDGTGTLGENSDTLTLSGFAMSDMGMYRCEVTNDAGTGMDSITIELGVPPVGVTAQLSPSGPVVLGTTVDLMCQATTGHETISYSWTDASGVTVFPDDTDGSITVLLSTSGNYGTYTCTATNDFGTDIATVDVVQAVAPSVTLAADQVASPILLAGDTLTLSVSIADFNLPLTDISWMQGSTTITDGVGGVIITNSPTLPVMSGSVLSTLQLSTLTPADSDTFTVTATNAAGNTMVTFTVSVEDPVNVTVPVADMMVVETEGDMVTFTCTATGVPAPSFTWSPPDDGDRISVNADPAVADDDGFISVTSNLTISSLLRNDTGTFTCTASNTVMGSIMMMSRTFTLTVNFAPSITVSPVSPVVLLSSSPLSLNCTADGLPLPTISWIRTLSDGSQTEFSMASTDLGGRSLEISTTPTSSTVQSVLTIDSTVVMDTANYSCRASNTVGNATSLDAPVSVFAAPVITMVSTDSQEFTVHEQMNITITCSATGFPAPNLSFFRGTEMITNSGRIQLVEGKEGSGTGGLSTASLVFTLSNAEDADSGEFSCVASTNIPVIGSLADTVNFTIAVLVGPNITSSPMNQIVVSPSNTTFTCVAEGLPRPTISWFITVPNGSLVELPRNDPALGLSIEDTTGPGDRVVMSVTTITNILPFLGTTYTCVASNEVDTQEAAANLTVLTVPEIMAPPEGFVLTVDQFQPVTFTCAAAGTPLPEISWIRQINGHDFTLVAGDSITIDDPVVTAEFMLSDGRGVVMGVNRSLTMMEALDEDSGSYFCIANSITGEVRREFDLVVQVAANITDPPDDVTVTAPGAVSFTCTASGVPRPNITWFNPTSEILMSGSNGVTVMEMMEGDREIVSTLSIATTAPSVAGQYRCVADNGVTGVGDVNDVTALLMVYVSPMVTSVYPDSSQMNYTVNMGDVVTFQCVATGIPAPSITWFRNGTELSNSRVTLGDPSESTTTDGDGEIILETSRSLNLSMTEDGDSGSYECRASNDATPGEDSESLDLIVQIPPATPVITEPTTVTVTQPEAAMFACTAVAKPRPSITWYKVEENDSRTMLTGTEEGVSITAMDGDTDRTSNSTLSFDPSRPSFSAVYVCVATNPVDSAETSATLTVYVSPNVTSVYPDPSQTNYTVNMGDVVTFQCVATGIPAPSITWLRNGTELSNSRVTLGDLSEATLVEDSAGEMILQTSRSLNLSMTQDSDSGSYECRASNDATPGEISESFEVIVQIPPATPVITEPTTVTVTQPEAAMFVCTAVARPRPSITWYKVEEDDSRTMLTGTEEGMNITGMDGDTNRTRISTLSFDPSRPSFSTVYVCVATNPVDSAEANATIIVYVSPMVTSVYQDSQMNYTVNMGEVVTFQCVATGIPAPSITWFRNGIELSSAADSRVTLGDLSEATSVADNTGEMILETSRTLALSMTEDDDSGSYECRASNNATNGSDTETFELIVQIQPDTPVIDETNVTVTQPEAAMFVCAAVARPRPSITWYKVEENDSRTMLTGTEEGVNITAMDGDTDRTRISILSFDPPRPSFSAVYVCVATNPVDSAEASATLTVYVSPNITSVYPDEPSQMNYTVNMGDVVTFECVATGIPAPSITWFRNGTELSSSRVTLGNLSESTAMDGDGEIVLQSTRTLNLSMTQDNDSSSYECRASNDATNGEISESFEVIVQIPPATPVITEQTTVTVTQPEAAVFVCTAVARPRPSITWYKVEEDDSRTMLTGTEEGVNITAMDGDTDRTSISTLSFDPSRPSFSAVYVCVATNPVDSAEASATLNVYVVPDITLFVPEGGRYVVNVTDTVTFQCRVTGFPPPTIQWFRGTQPLDPASDSRISLSEHQNLPAPVGLSTVERTLTITNVTANDTAEDYRCTATNIATDGMDTETFELFVQVPPVVVPLAPNQRVTTNVSESAALRFRIDNAAPPVLTSDIRWYYTGRIPSGEPDFTSSDFLDITYLTNRTSQSTLTYSEDLLTLDIVNIVQALNVGEETDAGRYYLRADHPAGPGNNHTDVVVFGPPQIIGGPSDQFVINDGSNAVFACSAIADPEHNVQWSFTDSDGVIADKIATTDIEAPGSSKYSIDRLRTATFGQLTVNNVTYEDRGVYTCRAENEIGFEDDSANLTVHVTPIIRTVSRPNDTVLSQPVAIFCLATGSPIPSFTWQRNGADITDEDRINIFSFTPELANGGYESSGFVVGSGQEDISDLLMGTGVTMEMVMSLGELGAVGMLSIRGVVREDMGDYTCTASNELPQTARLNTTSTVSLVVLERPDPPEAIAAVEPMLGPLSVVLRWRPAFDGNRDVLGFMLYSRNVNTSGPVVLVVNISVSETAMQGNISAYNITGMTIQPFTQYTFRVVSCNVIGCSDQSSKSPIVQTLEYTSSPPQNVMVTAATNITLTVQWQAPETPNGIITAYRITFSGVKDYNASFSQTGSLMRQLSALQMNTNEGTIGVMIEGLVPGTTYTVVIQAVNGAMRNNGVGMASEPDTGVTESDPPPRPPPPEPVVTPPLELVDEEPRTVIIPLPQFSTMNGQISHYQVVVVLIPLAQTPSDLGDPDEQFRSPDVYSAAFCDQELTSAKAYITAEFGADLFPSSELFIVGGQGADAPNDRPDTYTNGLLCYEGQYVFFVRAYTQLDAESGLKRSVRQADNEASRQYINFTSSNYFGTTTIEPAPAPTLGIAIGVVVGVILVLLVVAIVIVVVVVVVRRQSDSYKTDYYDGEKNGDTTGDIILTNVYPPHEEDNPEVRQPVPLAALGPHVERMHLNENCGFGEEYRIIQDKAPKKPVDTCVMPENKPRNRYANIQCFDETRVTLKPIEGAEHDYINANFIDGYNRKREYIAAQGPLPDTISDFWRLIWDHNSPTVVMLTNLLEKMKVKCSQYWPNNGSSQYSNFSVTLVNTITHADFVIRHFHLKNLTSGETREVKQYHFISWPDFGVPRHATPLLYFLRRIRNVHKYSDNRPLVIHCSAGVGRTGSLIVIDMETQRAEKEKCVDPFNTVMELRQQRNHMVQTEAQYVFVHDAVLEATSSGNTEVVVDHLSQHMKKLEHIDEENESGYQKEFMLLKQFKVNIREFTDANDDNNKFKNKLANALPYNYNRVHLQMSPGIPGSDYINASYIDGYSKRATYIATQGPLKNTVEDFWRMVWEREVSVVVMLTQLEEKGKEQCAQYWPQSEDSPEKVGNYTIELISEGLFEDYLIRELKVTDVPSGKTRTVKHFHFLTWPENGAPASGGGMVDLIDQVTRTQQHTGDKPIVVHCSAGIGRTGAFCSLSTAIERVKAEGVVDVFHTIKHLRTQRPHMVQTVDQYIFCYRAIREYVESLNNYSNFQ